jgi:hypothetical protein
MVRQTSRGAMNNVKGAGRLSIGTKFNVLK